MDHTKNDLHADVIINKILHIANIAPISMGVHLTNPYIAPRMGIVIEWNARTREIHSVEEMPIRLSLN